MNTKCWEEEGRILPQRLQRAHGPAETFFFFNIYSFIFGCAGSSLLSRGYTLAAVCGLLLVVASLWVTGRGLQ